MFARNWQCGRQLFCSSGLEMLATRANFKPRTKVRLNDFTSNGCLTGFLRNAFVQFQWAKYDKWCCVGLYTGNSCQREITANRNSLPLSEHCKSDYSVYWTSTFNVDPDPSGRISLSICNGAEEIIGTSGVDITKGSLKLLRSWPDTWRLTHINDQTGCRWW